MEDLKSSAQELADLFGGFADTVRAYFKAHSDEFSTEQMNDLKSRIVQFEDLQEEFEADDIEDTLAQVASKVQDLKAATAKAKDALKTVKRIEDATRIVAGLIGAGQCAARGDLGGTAEKLADLAGSFVPAGDTATAHG